MIHSKNVLLPRRRLVTEWCNKNVVENRHRKRLFLLRTCFPTPYITSFDPVGSSERSLFWKLLWGPVRIVEDLPNGFALGRLREPDHVVRRADLYKREPRLQIFGGYENFATKTLWERSRERNEASPVLPRRRRARFSPHWALPRARRWPGEIVEIRSRRKRGKEGKREKNEENEMKLFWRTMPSPEALAACWISSSPSSNTPGFDFKSSLIPCVSLSWWW